MNTEYFHIQRQKKSWYKHVDLGEVVCLTQPAARIILLEKKWFSCLNWNDEIGDWNHDYGQRDANLMRLTIRTFNHIRTENCSTTFGRDTWEDDGNLSSRTISNNGRVLIHIIWCSNKGSPASGHKISSPYVWDRKSHVNDSFMLKLYLGARRWKDNGNRENDCFKMEKNIELTGTSISPIAERQADLREDSGLQSSNVLVNACNKGID